MNIDEALYVVILDRRDYAPRIVLCWFGIAAMTNCSKLGLFLAVDELGMGDHVWNKHSCKLLQACVDVQQLSVQLKLGWWSLLIRLWSSWTQGRRVSVKIGGHLLATTHEQTDTHRNESMMVPIVGEWCSVFLSWPRARSVILLHHLVRNGFCDCHLGPALKPVFTQLASQPSPRYPPRREERHWPSWSITNSCSLVLMMSSTIDYSWAWLTIIL